MNRKNKSLTSALSLSLALIMLTACSSGGSTTNSTTLSSDGTKSAATASDSDMTTADSGNSKYQTTYGNKQFDNVTINVELFDRSNAPEGSTITDNRWTEYINEEMGKVGITVNFVAVPRSDEVTKMQAMMGSGTAPDITLTYTYAYAEDYFNQGGIWDLSEFIDGSDQAENLKDYLGTEVLDIGRNVDGNLYGIVAKRATTATSNLFIRKDWLDKLNLAVPTTTDELHNALTQFVTNNPDGRTDVIGANFFQSWNIRMAFSQLASDETQWDIADGDTSFQDYYDPGMKEYYKFMNQLYNEGILAKEYYDWSEDDFKSKIVTGALGMMEYNVNGTVDVLRGKLMQTLQQNEPEAEFVSMPALKNVNDGEQYSEAYALGGLICIVPKTASEETVEACMTYLDWQATMDGGFVLYHGFEGEHFNYNDNNVPVVIDSTYNAKDKDWIRTDLFLVGNQGYFKTVDEFNECTAAETPDYEQHAIDNYTNALTGTIHNMTTYTSPSTSGMITDIGIIRDQYTVDCITCPEEDFEATFSEYISELENAGIQTIIDERTAYFES